jgi:phosphomevalonate decarboxylase
VLKATARAYPIQGLIKYHGLKNRKLRIPYHDSISVCMGSLPTITTVDFATEYRSDIVRLDGREPSPREHDRIATVLNAIRKTGRLSMHAKIESRNPPVKGKGLGYSASGFAALGLAASRALGLQLKERDLSQLVRLGAGSAARSLVGGFSILYANRRGLSYAEQLASPESIKLRTVIVPVPADIKTDSAHQDVLESPFYKTRLRYVPSKLRQMKRALKERDIIQLSQLAEEDTLNLHAITMTGRQGLVLFSPLSIMIISEVRRLRNEDDVPVWFSLDTGPSVFVNTTREALARVEKALGRLSHDLVVSSPGGRAEVLDKHLF